jgi:uncharacterized protein
MNETVARDRNGLEVLGYEACQELLRGRNVGRVAIVVAGAPTIFPVVYTVAGASIVFRSPVGSKLDAAERSQPIAFEIDAHDDDARRGWSVLVTGVADLIDDPEIVAGLEALGLDSWALDDAGELQWVRLRAESVTGRAAGRG